MKRKILFIALLVLLFALSTSAQTEFVFEATIISDTAKLRSEPKTTAKVVRTLKKDTKILTTTTESKKGWYYVSANKIKGWLHGNDFEFVDLFASVPSEINLVPAGWYLIAKTAQKDDGYSYYYLLSSVKRKDSDLDIMVDGLKVELWTRVVPFDAQKFAKKGKMPKNFAYLMQYVTLECKNKRMSTESITLYDKNDGILPFNDLFYRTYSEPIVPNSIGESLWRKFCSD